MRLPLCVYVPRQDAIEAGMTHEGRLFGCPAWLRVDSEDQVTGTPKVPVLHVWCLLVDSLMEAATYFLSEDAVLETPITVGERIA